MIGLKKACDIALKCSVYGGDKKDELLFCVYEFEDEFLISIGNGRSDDMRRYSSKEVAVNKKTGEPFIIVEYFSPECIKYRATEELIKGSKTYKYSELEKIA